MRDHDLIERAISGDRDAFATLVTRHRNVVVAVALAVTRDHALAEDAAQDAFVVGWRQLAKLDDRSRLGPWLAGIARNLAKSARRRTARREALEPNEVEAPPVTPHEQLADREERTLVLNVLDELPQPQREALVLYYFEDRSVEQVAAGLGVSPNVAKQRLHRARHAARARLSPHFESAAMAMRPNAAFGVGVMAAIAIGTVTDATAATTSVATHATKGKAMLASKFVVAASVLVAAGGVALYATPWTSADAASHRTDDHAFARVVSPTERAQLTNAIATARAQRTATPAPALPAAPASVAQANSAAFTCTKPANACTTDYLVEVAMKVGKELRDTCEPMRDFPGAAQIHATIDSEPGVGAMFTSVEIDERKLPAQVTSLLGGDIIYRFFDDRRGSGKPFVLDDTERSHMTEELRDRLASMLAEAGSGARIDLDGKLVPIEQVRDVVQNASWDGPVVHAPRIDLHAVASPELRECIVNTLYSMELDAATTPGELKTDFVVTGSRRFAAPTR